MSSGAVCPIWSAKSRLSAPAPGRAASRRRRGPHAAAAPVRLRPTRLQCHQQEMEPSRLLRRHAVPVPETLAVAASEHGVATLSTYLPGVRLDVANETLPEDERRQAWRAAGETLRRAHEIAFPAAGEIVGDRLAPFAAPWAEYMTDTLADDLRWLQAAVGGTTVDSALLERVVAAARRVLRERPVRLLHNDALPQNILVAPSALVTSGPDRWRCTGWLDWEF